MKNNFEKIYKKYVNKKAFFKKQIEKFATKNVMDLHTKGHKLLSEAEKLVLEIRTDLENNESEKNLKKKVYRLNQVYKNLVHLSKPLWHKYGEAFIVATVLVVLIRNFLLGFYLITNGSSDTTLLVGDRVIASKIAYSSSKPEKGDLIVFDDPNFEYGVGLNRFWQKYIGYALPALRLSAGPDNLIRRVIAKPGDIIEGRVEDDRAVIYLNEQKIEEPYINKYPLIALETRTGFLDLNYIGFIPIPSLIKKKHRYPIFYTYVPKLEFSQQPYYSMTSELVGLEPGTLRPWLLKQGTPRKSEIGTIIDVFGPITVPKGKYWVMCDNRINKVGHDSRLWGLLDEKLIHGKVKRIIYSIDSEEPLWVFELIKSPIKFWSKLVRWHRFFKGVS